MYFSPRDILSSIYRSLHTNLTPSEFNTFQTPTDQRCATRAYEHRYRWQRSFRVYEEEKRGGMKRVNFLMEHTQFFGIFHCHKRVVQCVDFNNPGEVR